MKPTCPLCGSPAHLAKTTKNTTFVICDRFCECGYSATPVAHKAIQSLNGKALQLKTDYDKAETGRRAALVRLDEARAAIKSVNKQADAAVEAPPLGRPYSIGECLAEWATKKAKHLERKN